MLGFFLFFMLACLLLLAGILAFFIHLPDPDGWLLRQLLRPRWHGFGFLHCCAIRVVGVVVVGFPMLLLSDLEGRSAGRIIAVVGLAMSLDLVIGSYAAYLLTGGRYEFLVRIAAGVLLAIVVVCLLFAGRAERKRKFPRHRNASILLGGTDRRFAESAVPTVQMWSTYRFCSWCR
jgi:hypothetical protein